MRHQIRGPLCAAGARGRREATPSAVASPALVAHADRVLRPDLGAATWCSAVVVCLRSRATVSPAAVQQNSSRYQTRCVSDTAPWRPRSTAMMAVALVVGSRPRTLTSTPMDDSSTSMVPRSLPEVGGAGADAQAPAGDGWHERSPHPRPLTRSVCSTRRQIGTAECPQTSCRHRPAPRRTLFESGSPAWPEPPKDSGRQRSPRSRTRGQRNPNRPRTTKAHPACAGWASATPPCFN